MDGYTSDNQDHPHFPLPPNGTYATLAHHNDQQAECFDALHPPCYGKSTPSRHCNTSSLLLVNWFSGPSLPI